MRVIPTRLYIKRFPCGNRCGCPWTDLNHEQCDDWWRSLRRCNFHCLQRSKAYFIWNSRLLIEGLWREVARFRRECVKEGVILLDSFVLARDSVDKFVALMISAVKEKFYRNNATIFPIHPYRGRDNPVRSNERSRRETDGNCDHQTNGSTDYRLTLSTKTSTCRK